MIYPLYDFKKRENPRNSQILAVTEEARDLIHNLNKTLYNLSSQYGDIIKSDSITGRFNSLAALHKESNNQLLSPPFIITAIGTTSSGKSTFINSLLGAKLSPMNADELSVGTLRFSYSTEFKSNCRVTVDAQIANKFWENGIFVKSYIDAYSQIKSIMDIYRKEQYNEKISPPHIMVETSYFAGNNPKFLGLDENVELEVIELPWTVVDSENLEFVSDKVKSSFVIFLIDYTVLFNKETRETNLLFSKLMEMKKDVGNKEAMIFVLNKSDLRNMDDDEIEIAIEKCKKEIKNILKIDHDVNVIPLNSLLLYYVQCVHLGYENGNLKGYSPDSETPLDETQKLYFEIIKTNLQKCLHDQAKSVSEIQASNEANVDLIYEMRKILQKDKIPTFQMFEKFWKESIRKSGGLQLFEHIREKVKVHLNSLLLYLPMNKIANESSEFIHLLENKIKEGKEIDQNKIDSEFQHLNDVQNSLKEKISDTKESLQKHLDEHLSNLRRPDTKLRREAISELDIGQIEETTHSIRKITEHETILPVEKAFIEEMRPDNLSNSLIKTHSWNEKYAKQLAEHFDFLRMKLFNEKRFIDDGRVFETFEADNYEKDKIKDINKQFELLCNYMIQALDERLKFEMQNTVDELSVRVNRWLIKKTREIHEYLSEILTESGIDKKLPNVVAPEIPSFKFDGSYLHKVNLKPAMKNSIEKIQVDKGSEPVYKKTWYTLWLVKVRDTITKEKEVTLYYSVREQVNNWSESISKLEADLWGTLCDTLSTFFRKAMESYEFVTSELLKNLETILSQENVKVVEKSNKIHITWENIDGLLTECRDITKKMYQLSCLPEKEVVITEQDSLAEAEHTEEGEHKDNQEPSEVTV